MTPILYSATETAFTSNGLGRLFDCVECLVTEERNGLFECEFKYPITGRHYSDIVEGCYISCTHDDDGDRQPFRIYRRSAPIDGVVTFNARHISYALSNVILSPYTAANIGDAFTGFGTHAINTNPFTFWTDKTTVASFAVTNPTSIRGVMGGVEGSILDVYGGEWDYDGLTVKLWAARGTNSGVTIRYGKNLSDLNQTKDAGNCYNSVVPFWRGDVDGVDTLVTIPGYIVTAAGVTDPVPVIMDMSGDFDSQPTANQLQTAAAAFLANNTPWVPSETLKVDFVQLWQTSDYADIANLQKVRLCDTVNVVYPALGVTATGIKVVKVVYDVLRERYAEMELGQPSVNFGDVLTAESAAMINKVNTDTKSFFESEIAHATDLITGGQGGYVRFGLNAYGQPEEIYIMDTASILTATNILRLNKNGIGFSTNGGSTYSTAWTIDGSFVADYIKTGTLTTVTIQGPNANTYWNLLTGVWQSYGEKNISGQIETAPGTYTPVTYTVEQTTRIDGGEMTVTGRIKNSGDDPITYVDLGVTNDSVDYTVYEFIPGNIPQSSLSYPYVGLNMTSNRISSFGGSGKNQTPQDLDTVTYSVSGQVSPDYIELGRPVDVKENGSVYNDTVDRNVLRLSGGWMETREAIIFYKYCDTWNNGNIRTFYNPPIICRPAWEIAVNDDIYIGKMVLAAWVTGSKTMLHMFVPFCRPINDSVLGFQIIGTLHKAYTASGTAVVSSDQDIYTFGGDILPIVEDMSDAGINLLLEKRSGSWSAASNNGFIIVELYDMNIKALDYDPEEE